MKNDSNDFFWPSYTDLMTSLFFIMLVLYVLTYAKLEHQQRVTVQQLRKIKEIQNAVKQLPQEYFVYQQDYKRFSLNRQIQFPKGSSQIGEEYTEYLSGVGKSIVKLVDKLKEQYKDENIKYLIVLEGMASEDSYPLNYELSYTRSLALYKFWKSHDIEFDANICDIQISGSGTGGIGRDTTDERKNQRFLIHIVPKIGDIKVGGE